MFKLSSLLDSKFILLISLVFAFILPKYAYSVQPFVIYSLFLMLTLSLKDIDFIHIKDVHWKDVAKLLFMNFILMASIYIISAKLFFSNPVFSNAIIVFALMPPAVNVVSFSYLLRANTKLAIVAEITSYLATIILLPLGAFLFFGGSFDQKKIVEIIIVVIIMPLFFSRLVHYAERKTVHIKKSIVKAIIMLCMGLITYVTVGLSRDQILNNPKSLIPIVIFLVLVHFGLGLLIYHFVKKRMSKEDSILFVLFGTLKNSGAAIPICLLMFGAQSLIVIAVSSLIFPVYYLFFEWFFKSKVMLEKI